METTPRSILQQRDKVMIKHNTTSFEVDLEHLVKSSKYFARIYKKQKDKNFIIKDNHSDIAYSTFFKVAINNKAMIPPQIADEVNSLFYEWECDHLIGLFPSLILGADQMLINVHLKYDTRVYKMEVSPKWDFEKLAKEARSIIGFSPSDPIFLMHCGHSLESGGINGLENGDRIIALKQKCSSILIAIETLNPDYEADKEYKKEIIAIEIYPFSTVSDLKRVYCALSQKTPKYKDYSVDFLFNDRIIKNDDVLIGLDIKTGSQLKAKLTLEEKK